MKVGQLVVTVVAALVLGGHASAQRPRPGVGEDPLVTLGRGLFGDAALSSPVGQSCASCHSASAGFKFPDSHINRDLGVAPGATPTRHGFRSVPTISYALFAPNGPPHAVPFSQLRGMRRPPGGATDGGELLFIGGLFWDGHANNLEDQARQPFFNANEMNNVVHNLPSPELLAAKVAASPEAALFRQVFGAAVFAGPAQTVLDDVTSAIAAFERSPQVSPFSSRYDDYVAGRGTLTDEELDGLRLATGSWNGRPDGAPYRKSAQCILCHGVPQSGTWQPDLWTDFCYANIGVPRNEHNPYYHQTNEHSNPLGYNPDGRDFVDIGLGGLIYPLNDLPPGNEGPGSNGAGDFLQINGAFKAPTLRNVDRRPSPDFVKPYMHNGTFKSLKEVVHFYNTRNLTTFPGEVIDFTQPRPYAHLRGRPLWPPPEVMEPDSLQNPQGDPDGQVGNLGLTDEEEDHIVAFLKALSDR
jgi:cytochrome c peroxidase